MVTLATAIEDDVASESTTFSSPGTITIGNASVSNFNKTSYGTQTLEQATWVVGEHRLRPAGRADGRR